MEIAEQNAISFVGMNITKSGNRLETSVYRKSTNAGLLLHYHSHVDKRCKDFLLTTMIHRAHQLSSTPTAFSDESNKLHSTFLNLDYPINLINSAINNFFHNNNDNIDADRNTMDDSSTIMVPQPFKDQQSVNSVKKQMQNFSANIGVQIKPGFQSKKIGQILALKEKKPPIVNNQCVVYKFECELNPALNTQKDSSRQTLYMTLYMACEYFFYNHMFSLLFVSKEFFYIYIRFHFAHH